MNNIASVVLIGRVNTGKSTLFNKIIGKRQALESTIAGTTRDYNKAIAAWNNQSFELVDTGGFLPDEPDQEIAKTTIELAQQQAEQATVLVLVVDHQQGLTPFDKALFNEARTLNKPIIVAVNKVDKPKDRDSAYAEFTTLGADTIIALSGISGAGVGDLLDAIGAHLPGPPTTVETDQTTESLIIAPTEMTYMKVAIVGQPNVGKSSLLNALVGKQRAIVSATAHTTRDAHDETLQVDEHTTMQLIDTAGIRRNRKKGDVVEKFSIDAALRTLRRSQVALFVIDISRPIQFQDKHLGQRIVETGNSVVIIANKWDLIPDKTSTTINHYRDTIYAYLPFLQWAPIIFTSTINNQRIKDIVTTTDTVWRERFRTIDEGTLDKFIKKVIRRHKPSRGKGVAHPYIYRLRQTNTNPPRFELTIKYQDSLHPSYLRFIQNQLREKFGFTGTPININVHSVK